MILRAIENQVFRQFAPMAVKRLSKPKLGAQDPLVTAVLTQASSEFQAAPPLTIHAIDPQLLAAVWHLTREAYVVRPEGRARREAVATAVSSLNECPYCVTVHEAMYVGAGRKASELENREQMPHDVRVAFELACATLTPGSPLLARHDDPSPELPQLYGTAIAFHYINRMVSVFLEDSPVALPGMTSAPGKVLARASLSIFGKRMTGVDPAPGECVGKRDAELPTEFAWAGGNPAVAEALAHFAAATDAAGDVAVPTSIRKIVSSHLSQWNGEPAPLIRNWVEDLVHGLAPTEQPTARLALLSARAAYQVDDKLIEEVRRITPNDETLVQLVAWASAAAVRRIASWFDVPAVARRGKVA